MSDYVVKFIKSALSDTAIILPDKSQLNGYGERPEVWEAIVSLTDAHKVGGANAAKQAWSEVIAKTVPDIAAIVDRPRLIKHISEFEETPPIEYLIPHEVPAHSLVVIYGASGSCKSFLAIDYGGEIALKQSIVYIAGEGESGYYARYHAWLKHTGHKKEGKFHLVAGALQLLKLGDVEAFIEEARDYKPAAVIIDTLARSMVGGDENNQKDMGLFVYGCDLIRKALNCTVIVVHHTGKAGDSERGSSVLRGAADMMIAVTNEEGIVKIACGKSKDSKPFMHRYCRLQEVTIMQNGKQVVSAVLEAWQRVKVDAKELSPNQARILECLASEIFAQGAKASDIKGYSNITNSSFYTALNSLIKRGYAKKLGKGASVDPVIITHIGMDWIREKSKINPEQMSESA